MPAAPGRPESGRAGLASSCQAQTAAAPAMLEEGRRLRSTCKPTNLAAFLRFYGTSRISVLPREAAEIGQNVHMASGVRAGGQCTAVGREGMGQPVPPQPPHTLEGEGLQPSCCQKHPPAPLLAREVSSPHFSRIPPAPSQSHQAGGVLWASQPQPTSRTRAAAAAQPGHPARSGGSGRTHPQQHARLLEGLKSHAKLSQLYAVNKSPIHLKGARLPVQAGHRPRQHS